MEELAEEDAGGILPRLKRKSTACGGARLLAKLSPFTDSSRHQEILQAWRQITTRVIVEENDADRIHEKRWNQDAPRPEEGSADRANMGDLVADDSTLRLEKQRTKYFSVFSCDDLSHKRYRLSRSRSFAISVGNLPFADQFQAVATSA